MVTAHDDLKWILHTIYKWAYSPITTCLWAEDNVHSDAVIGFDTFTFNINVTNFVLKAAASFIKIYIASVKFG